ncbi:V-type ATP synthase subunit I [Halarchaeum sp. CBA1220]|uniref:V-type ATP synthase subunit I n=1 Tax=Halarchaeum sp. CBA1220 TaxID=1853682 RepID=UPI000F3A84B3|nr:V-type ATP synthase subunit I [Halarchaeum sp. CBA1220]QLC33205.1 V-type ATP synthase subunit I [Halarchaeum sp. CBA1220]
MLRPEQMSKVSVTGTKNVIQDVIEVTHDQRVVHLTDYTGEHEGFASGSPLEGAEAASEKLVTVRSLINILDVSEEDAGPARIVTDEALEEEFESVRQQVNELDDRRDDLEDDLEDLEEEIAAAEPFVELGIDLDLLQGYDNLDVVVGEGDTDAVGHALADASAIQSYEVFSEGDVFAAVAYPESGAPADALSEVFVGLDVERYAVPDAEESPEEYLQRLEHRKQQLVSDLESVESDLESLRLEHAGFLLAAEEKLTIEVQKSEAPLHFATTEHAFVAEGWIPTTDYESYASALKDELGERVEVEELERAEYEPPGHEIGHGEQEAATDGGTVDRPPVVQKNPKVAEPFEMLVRVINRPNYFDLDPTIILFLTFPVFYGFMIGDVGYGVLYTAAGWWMYTRLDSAALASLGGVAVISGVATIVFGVLYGEVFGFHLISEYLWSGTPPLHKGLMPANADWARLWLIVSILVALGHLTLGYAIDTYKRLHHSAWDALTEGASWAILMIGMWIWVFSHALDSAKPPILFQTLAGQPLGFTGFSATVGWAALAVGLVGYVLLIYAEGAIGAVEGALNSLTHVLSYTRLAAVMLAKGGMAFVVNLLFFGAYRSAEGEFHFMLNHDWSYVQAHHSGAELMFGGLVHGPITAVLGGLVIFVLGHALVLALGVTSAGLQAVRLEYVEFFGKFYEGGGEKYEPFGHQRTYTTQD